MFLSATATPGKASHVLLEKRLILALLQAGDLAVDGRTKARQHTCRGGRQRKN